MQASLPTLSKAIVRRLTDRDARCRRRHGHRVRWPPRRSPSQSDGASGGGVSFPSLFGECICAFVVFIFLCVCPIEIFVLLIGIESTRLIKYTIFFYCFAWYNYWLTTVLQGSSSHQVGYNSNSSLQIPEPEPQQNQEEEHYHGCRKLHPMQGRSQGAI